MIDPSSLYTFGKFAITITLTVIILKDFQKSKIQDLIIDLITGVAAFGALFLIMVAIDVVKKIIK